MRYEGQFDLSLFSLYNQFAVMNRKGEADENDFGG